MTDASQEREPNDVRWWLSTTGKAHGPYTESYVIAGLKTNTLPVNAHACPVGGQEWKPVGQWPPFATAVVLALQVTPTPSAPAMAAASAPVLTNPQLPPMANRICAYSIVLSPFLCALYGFSGLMTLSPTFRDDSDFFGLEVLMLILSILANLGLTILLVVVGIRLKALRRSGATIIKAAIWLGLPFSLLYLVAVFVVAAIAGMSEGEHFAEQTPTTAATLIDFVMTIISLVEYTFQIIALVWLHRHTKNLPLTAY